MKQIFASKIFAANIFASGVWRGIGVVNIKGTYIAPKTPSSTFIAPRVLQTYQAPKTTGN